VRAAISPSQIVGESHREREISAAVIRCAPKRSSMSKRASFGNTKQGAQTPTSLVRDRCLPPTACLPPRGCLPPTVRLNSPEWARPSSPQRVFRPVAGKTQELLSLLLVRALACRLPIAEASPTSDGWPHGYRRARGGGGIGMPVLECTWFPQGPVTVHRFSGSHTASPIVARAPD
jgi:hypothetical protein